MGQCKLLGCKIEVLVEFQCGAIQQPVFEFRAPPPNVQAGGLGFADMWEVNEEDTDVNAVIQYMVKAEMKH